MGDRVDKETRSRVMSTVRNKNTRLEEKLVGILEGAGIGGFTRYLKNLPGTPDIAFESEKVVVFLDSCFWHGCPQHLRRPGSNQAYWEAKIEKNIERDKRQRDELRHMGWSVLRVWEHDLKEPAGVVSEVSRALDKRSVDLDSKQETQ